MNIQEMFAMAGGPQPRIQFLRPDGDYAPPAVAYEPYGAAELWLCVDDVEPDEDATYVHNDLGNGFWLPSLSGLSYNWSDIASRLHKIVVRAKYTGSSAITPWFQMILLQGAALQVMFNERTLINTQYTDYEFVLDQSQIDRISDYDELRLSINCDSDPNPVASIHWTQIFMQIGEEA